MTGQKTLGFYARGGGVHDRIGEVERVVRASRLCAGSYDLLVPHSILQRANREID